jgi:hypothetical protein
MKKTKNKKYIHSKKNHNRTKKNINLTFVNNPLSYYVNYIVSLHLLTFQMPIFTTLKNKKM